MLVGEQELEKAPQLSTVAERELDLSRRSLLRKVVNVRSICRRGRSVDFAGLQPKSIDSGDLTCLPKGIVWEVGIVLKVTELSTARQR